MNLEELKLFAKFWFEAGWTERKVGWKDREFEKRFNFEFDSAYSDSKSDTIEDFFNEIIEIQEKYER